MTIRSWLSLPHGVGFHHAGLPIEVLEALEQAVRDDTLPYLTCTSTLTDGVNLPVRTVIIYDQTYQGQDEEARLRGARPGQCDGPRRPRRQGDRGVDRPGPRGRAHRGRFP